MTTKPPLHKILQGILHTEIESKKKKNKKKTMEGQAVPNHRREKERK
jgi:hypothetical protein